MTPEQIAARLTAAEAGYALTLLIGEAEKAEAAASQPGWKQGIRRAIRRRAAALRRVAEVVQAIAEKEPRDG